MAAKEASAQINMPPAPAPREYTKPPAFSPWLNMNRADPGPLGPYLSYVRPEQRLRRAMVDQQQALRRTQAQMNVLSRRQTAIETRGSATPTGVGGTYMNYSHFFPSATGR